MGPRARPRPVRSAGDLAHLVARSPDRDQAGMVFALETQHGKLFRWGVRIEEMLIVHEDRDRDHLELPGRSRSPSSIRSRVRSAREVSLATRQFRIPECQFSCESGSGRSGVTGFIVPLSRDEATDLAFRSQGREPAASVARACRFPTASASPPTPTATRSPRWASKRRRAASSAATTRGRHGSTRCNMKLGLLEQPIDPAVLEPLLAAWRDLVDRTGAADRRALVGARRGSLRIELRRAIRKLSGNRGRSRVRDRRQVMLGGALVHARAALHGDARSRSRGHRDGRLVQPLVRARAAGGGLSRTADGGMLVNATLGLGSSIAQGEVTPDRFELDRDGTAPSRGAGPEGPRGELRSPAARPDRSGIRGARRRAVPDARQRFQRSPDPAARGGRARHPVEIEWAIDDERVTMLQARPLHLEAPHVPDEIWLQHPRLNGHPAGVGWGAGRAVVINCECEIGARRARRCAGDTRRWSGARSRPVARLRRRHRTRRQHVTLRLARARARIPMVLGVADATRRIPDGAQVAVDGVAGIVRWIS